MTSRRSAMTGGSVTSSRASGVHETGVRRRRGRLAEPRAPEGDQPRVHRDLRQVALARQTLGDAGDAEPQSLERNGERGGRGGRVSDRVMCLGHGEAERELAVAREPETVEQLWLRVTGIPE